MTQAAITLPGQQSKLALAIAPDKSQAVVTVPYAASLCTHVLALEDKTFATADATIEDIVSCDGQNLAGEVIREWRGAFTCSFLGNSQDLGWALAITLGTTTAASPVSASSAVFTLTYGTATAGTYSMIFDGRPTTPLAYNADATAIQAAIDALVGAGLYTVAGAGPFTITAGGTLANTYVRRPRVSPAASVTLTGGTIHSITTTTAGGPARQSYTITTSTADQPPAITAVLGYTNGKAWRISDLVVNELTVELQDSGFYRITISFIWSGLYELLGAGAFTWPACSTPRKLDVRDSAVLFGAVEKTDELKALTWTFSNNIQIVYATISKFGQAFLRQFPLKSEWKTQFQEDPSVAGSVYSLCVANTQEGTQGSFTARIGDPADGANLSNPETVTRLDGTAQAFGGTPALGRVPAFIRAFNSNSDAAKPTSATLITTYSGGYLAAA